MQNHVAFKVTIEDLLTAPRKLRAAGVTAVGGSREPIDEPVVFSWMPAASVFFDDLDGNFLEYIAMLDDEPRPEVSTPNRSSGTAAVPIEKTSSPSFPAIPGPVLTSVITRSGR